MIEKENVALEVAENVEPTTEEPEVQVEPKADESAKIYTEAEFNERLNKAVEKKIARREAKIHKEYQRKYGELENVLKAGTGKENVEDITGTFRQFYESKGVTIPSQPQYSSRDLELLAKADSETIISAGMDEVKDELDRLTELGVANMTAREKAMYRHLADHYKNESEAFELQKIGVTSEVYASKEFKEFASKFSSTTPITDVYNIYQKMQPQKPIQPAGSMKNTSSNDSGVKEFYTVEEARKFTREDLNKNPELMKAIERSMQKW